MMRRNPPKGYVYLDALGALLRKSDKEMDERAYGGLFKTTKLWAYTVKSGKTYQYWIITWDEYLEIVQSLAIHKPQFMYELTLTFGPFDSEEDAQKESVRVQQEIFETVYQDDLVQIDSNVYEKESRES